MNIFYKACISEGKSITMPAVVQAVPGDDFTVYAYCNDGAVRLVDIKPLIAKGGVFSPLADRDFFRDRLCGPGRRADFCGSTDCCRSVGGQKGRLGEQHGYFKSKLPRH